MYTYDLLVNEIIVDWRIYFDVEFVENLFWCWICIYLNECNTEMVNEKCKKVSSILFLLDILK